jgi:hypothetical protein
VSSTEFEGGCDGRGCGDCIFLVICAQPSHRSGPGSDPGYFTHIYITTRRLRLKNTIILLTLYLQYSRAGAFYFLQQKFHGYFKPRYVNVSEVKQPRTYIIAAILCNGHSPTEKCPFGFGCIHSGYVTVVGVGQRQRLYAGVRTLTWFYLSFFFSSYRQKGVGT